MATENDVSSMPECLNEVVEGAILSDRFHVSTAATAKKSATAAVASSASAAKDTPVYACGFSVTPVLVNFNSILRQQRSNRSSGEDCSVISGISNQDLLHAVVGLYDVCLSELTPDVLYATVCSKWAKTIVLVRDVKDVFLEFEMRRDKKRKKRNKPGEVVSEGKVGEADVYRCPQASDPTFSCCYTDSSESEEEDDSDDDEDFSMGINKYLSQAVTRKLNRDVHIGPFNVGHVGPENRIVAACTFEKKYIKGGEKIVHLSLMSIRKKFRGLGLGKYLIKQVKDPAVSGPHDAVVVHAETEAASFFTRCGFTDDLVLNSKWREIAEQFTNCTLLTYIPPYTGQSVSGRITDLDLIAVDQDLRKWNMKSMEAYQAQVTVIERMKAEMVRLRSMITAQEDIIQELRSKVIEMESHQVRTEKELLMHKMKDTNFTGAIDSEDTLDQVTSTDSLRQQYQVVEDADSQGSQSTRPKAEAKASIDTDNELKRYVVVPDNSVEIYDHGKDVAEFHKICEDFKMSLRKDESSRQEFTVTTVSKALLSSEVVGKYASAMKSRGEQPVLMKLYYCGAATHPERLEHILKDGFSSEDMVDGAFGKGLYFSRHASTAIRFSPPHKVLIAEVIVGKPQSLLTSDKGRQLPDAGFDSVLCPGRLCIVGRDDPLVQEYVIFNCSQALPLDLIEFTERRPSVPT